MSRDSVRYGRVPKRSRERGSTGSSEVTSNSSDHGGVSSPETTHGMGASLTAGGTGGSTAIGNTPGPDMSPTHASGNNNNMSPVCGGSNNNNNSGSGVTQVNLESKQLALYDIILTISQAHHAHCSYTEEKTRGLVRKPALMSGMLMELDQSSPSSLDGDHGGSSPSSLSDLHGIHGGQMHSHHHEQNKILIWQQFAVLMTPEIQRVVEFAKRIPGFLDLTQDDQLILIKVGFFEMWLVHVSRMINHVDKTLTFSDGSFVTRNQMDIMFDQDFVSGIFNFGLSFNSLHLNDTEIGLFTATVLLQSGLYRIRLFLCQILLCCMKFSNLY